MASQNQASRSSRSQGGKSGAQAAKPRQGQGGKSGARAAKPVQGRSANGSQAARQPGRQPTKPQASQLPRQRPASAAETTAAAGQPTGFRALVRSMGWVQITALVLSVLGLLDAIYLTIQEFDASIPTGCNSTGTIDCGAVLSSPESKLFGVIPVAVLGLAFFVSLVALNSPWAWRADRQSILAPWAQIRRIRMTVVGIGMVFVLYLVYAEIIEVGHICLYCTGVHIITFLLFCLLVFHTTFSSQSADAS